MSDTVPQDCAGRMGEEPIGAHAPATTVLSGPEEVVRKRLREDSPREAVSVQHAAKKTPTDLTPLGPVAPSADDIAMLPPPTDTSSALFAPVSDRDATPIPLGVVASASSSSSSSLQADSLGPCKMCGAAAKYSCPACQRRTCSVACVQDHKARHSCSGRRPASTFIPLKQMDSATLERDISFLTSVTNAAGAAYHDSRLANSSASALPPRFRFLLQHTALRSTALQLSPAGMRDRERNASLYSPRDKMVFWTLEFVFLSALSAEPVADDFAPPPRLVASDNTSVGADADAIAAGATALSHGPPRRPPKNSAFLLPTLAPESATWAECLDLLLLRAAAPLRAPAPLRGPTPNKGAGHGPSKSQQQRQQQHQQQQWPAGATVGDVSALPAPLRNLPASGCEPGAAAAELGNASLRYLLTPYAKAHGRLRKHQLAQQQQQQHQHVAELAATTEIVFTVPMHVASGESANDASAAVCEPASELASEPASAPTASSAADAAVATPPGLAINDDYVAPVAAPVSEPAPLAPATAAPTPAALRIFVRLRSAANDPLFTEVPLSANVGASVTGVAVPDFPRVYVALPGAEAARFAGSCARVNAMGLPASAGAALRAAPPQSFALVHEAESEDDDDDDGDSGSDGDDSNDEEGGKDVLAWITNR